jgi:pimeloyl-ACP methyl ester carboxylesterase
MAGQSRYADLDGVRVHYLEAGEGAPLVLLPGLGSSTRCSWGAILPHLAPSFRVLALDLPGQGDSEKPVRIYDLDYAVASTARFLAALGLERADVMGTSAGGLIAMATALEHPDCIGRLVLVAPAGLGRDVNWGLRLTALPVFGHVGAANWRWLVRRSLHWNFTDLSCISEELVTEYCRVRGLPGAQQALRSAMRCALGFRGLQPRLVLCERLARWPSRRSRGG